MHRPASRCEFDRVRNEVGQDLLDGIGIERSGQCVDRLHCESNSLSLGDWREGGDHAPCEGTEIEWTRREVHRPRLELRHVEDLVHQSEQATGVAERDIEPAFDLRVAASARTQILQWTDREGERGAELVRDVGEEPRLGMVERLECAVPLGELALAFAQGSRTLVNHLLEEHGASAQACPVPPDGDEHEYDYRDTQRPAEKARLPNARKHS